MSSSPSPGRLRVVQGVDGSWSWSYREEGSGLVLWGSRPERGVEAALEAARAAYPDADAVVVPATTAPGGRSVAPRPWGRRVLRSTEWSAAALAVGAAVAIARLTGWVRRHRTSG
jgi:hypothetical protein